MVFGGFTRTAALVVTTTVGICGENLLAQHIMNGGGGPVLRKPDDDEDHFDVSRDGKKCGFWGYIRAVF